MEKISKAEWDKIPADYKGVWTTERTDWRDWDQVRSQYMGKRTVMRDGALLVEGLSFEVVDEKTTRKTFTIENMVERGRIVSYLLTRYGRVVATTEVKTQGDLVSKFWELRRVARDEFGATHVRLPAGNVEAV